MQLRIKLFKERRIRHCGSLVCTKCKAQHLSVLYEGDVCKSCYVAQPVKRINYTAMQREQLPTTLRLRKRVEQILRVSRLPGYKFALLIGMCTAAFANWEKGRLGTLGQSRANTKIRAGIKVHFHATNPTPRPSLAEELREPASGVTSLGHDNQDDEENIFDDDEVSCDKDAAPVGSIWA